MSANISIPGVEPHVGEVHAVLGNACGVPGGIGIHGKAGEYLITGGDYLDYHLAAPCRTASVCDAITLIRQGKQKLAGPSYSGSWFDTTMIKVEADPGSGIEILEDCGR